MTIIKRLKKNRPICKGRLSHMNLRHDGASHLCIPVEAVFPDYPAPHHLVWSVTAHFSDMLTRSFHPCWHDRNGITSQMNIRVCTISIACGSQRWYILQRERCWQFRPTIYMIHRHSSWFGGGRASSKTIAHPFNWCVVRADRGTSMEINRLHNIEY